MTGSWKTCSSLPTAKNKRSAIGHVFPMALPLIHRPLFRTDPYLDRLSSARRRKTRSAFGTLGIPPGCSVDMLAAITA